MAGGFHSTSPLYQSVALVARVTSKLPSALQTSIVIVIIIIIIDDIFVNVDMVNIISIYSSVCEQITNSDKCWPGKPETK